MLQSLRVFIPLDDIAGEAPDMYAFEQTILARIEPDGLGQWTGHEFGIEETEVSFEIFFDTDDADGLFFAVLSLVDALPAPLGTTIARWYDRCGDRQQISTRGTDGWTSMNFSRPRELELERSWTAASAHWKIDSSSN